MRNELEIEITQIFKILFFFKTIIKSHIYFKGKKLGIDVYLP